jgi:hypothetical protein
MQQIPYPPLPWHIPGLPARPIAVPGPPDVPMLAPGVRQPGLPAPPPGAVAVWRSAVPETAPPYDDELAASQAGAGRTTAWSAVTGQDQAAATPGQGPDDEAAGQQDQASRRDEDGAGPPPPGQGVPWPSHFAQMLAETLAGTRPARQLTPWTTEHTRRRIRQLGPMLATGQRPRVRRVISSAPAAGVLELAAVVGFGPRVRLLAIRLERAQPRPYRRDAARWCCTAIESA